MVIASMNPGMASCSIVARFAALSTETILPLKLYRFSEDDVFELAVERTVSAVERLQEETRNAETMNEMIKRKRPISFIVYSKEYEIKSADGLLQKKERRCLAHLLDAWGESRRSSVRRQGSALR
jgi:hypothetical protein